MGNNWLNLMHLFKTNHDTENKLLLTEKGIYDKIVAERKNEINILNDEIKYGELTYNFKSENRESVSFKGFNSPLGLIKERYRTAL